MGKYTKIPEDTFKKLQLNAGILLTEFDPKSGTVTDANIVGATTGGVKFAAVPTFTDFGEDIDNCPKNMKELKRIESYEVTMSGSFVSVDAKSAKMLAGAADIAEEDPKKVVPRNQVKPADFADLWLVADYGDVDGAFIAVHMLNSLSTGGFSMQTTEKAKGAFEFSFMAHYSMDAQDKVPFELFISPTAAAAAMRKE